MTLILSSFVLVQVGLTGTSGMVSALIIGGVVCTALSVAGGIHHRPEDRLLARHHPAQAGDVEIPRRRSSRRPRSAA